MTIIHANQITTVFKTVSATTAVTDTTGIQKALLLVHTACAAISLIPSLSFAGSLAERSVTLLTATAETSVGLPQGDVLSRIVASFKTALAALGIAGIATATPALIIASLAGAIGVRALEIPHALVQQDAKKAGMHFGAALIDSLTLAGLVTGSHLFLITAGVTASAGMMVLSIYTFAYSNDRVHASCYAALAVLSAISSSKIASSLRPKQQEVAIIKPSRRPQISPVRDYLTAWCDTVQIGSS